MMVNEQAEGRPPMRAHVWRDTDSPTLVQCDSCHAICERYHEVPGPCIPRNITHTRDSA